MKWHRHHCSPKQRAGNKLLPWAALLLIFVIIFIALLRPTSRPLTGMAYGFQAPVVTFTGIIIGLVILVSALLIAHYYYQRHGA